MTGTRDRLRGRDLALCSSSATLYGALAIGPSLIVAIALAQLVLGRERVIAFGGDLGKALPEGIGPAGVDRLLGAGLSASWGVVAFATLAASAYGAGLRSALAQVAPQDRRSDRPPAWWLRILTLPLLGLAPLMVAGLLVLSPLLSRLPLSAGLWGTVLAVFLSLVWVWVLTWLPLAWAFRVVAPGALTWSSAVVAAVVTGAFISGFLQGFLLFLALPVDLGRPFGGLTAVGVVTSLLLWLWVLHAVVVVGYAFAWEWQRSDLWAQRDSNP